MKTMANVVLRMSGLLAGGFWLADALLEYLWFNTAGQGFWPILTAVDDPRDLLRRLLFAGAFVLGGVGIARMLKRLAPNHAAGRQNKATPRHTLNASADAEHAAAPLHREARADASNQPPPDVFRIITAMASTEHQQAEEALKTSQEYVRNLIESSLDMIIAVDLQRRITEFNKAAQTTFGYQLEDVLGQPVDMLYADPHEGLRIHQTTLREGQCVQEVVNQRKDGQVFPSFLSASGLRDARGELIGIMGVSRDITARKQAERTMRERYDRLQREHDVLATIATLPAVTAGQLDDVARQVTQAGSRALNVERVGVWLFDESGTQLINLDNYEASKKRHSQGGVLDQSEFRDEFAILKNAKYVDADEALSDPRIAGYLEGYLLPNRITSMLDGSIRIGERNLGTLCFEHVDTPHHWEADEIAFACQLADQIALALSNRERKQAEEALAQSEKKFRTITEQMTDIVFVTDALGGITYISPAMRKIFGFSPADVEGRRFTEFLPPSEIPKAVSIFTKTISTGAPCPQFELAMKRKDGSVFIGELNATRYQSEDQAGTIGLIRDITERKHAEQSLRQLNDTLELRVRQRTAELEAANRDLQEFAYIVSHDLKAPLRGINQLAQWLREDYAGALDAQGQEQLDLLMSRVERMELLIAGILDYSRATHGSDRDEPINLNTLVSQICDLLTPPDHITIQIARTLPVVHGDPVQLTQVFQNLLSNAVKFMDKPTGQITIDCVESDAAWTVQVEDNGPGIAPPHQARIFQIFQSCAPRDDRESTGIGLTIVKKIVECAGGRVWVEAEPGRGSRFSFTWPKRIREDTL